jgi:hypothetical protein
LIDMKSRMFVQCGYPNICFIVPLTLKCPKGLGYLKSPNKSFLADMPWSSEQQMVFR